jgi:drug/metabolite transporter (DMT)-like permease
LNFFDRFIVALTDTPIDDPEKAIETQQVERAKNDQRRVPIGIWLGLAAAILLDTGVQICWKTAVLDIPTSAPWYETILFALQTPLIYLVIAMFFAQLLNWMRVLSKADLSFAQPITSLSYLSVSALSVFFLHEIVSPGRLFGMALILGGVFFVSRTKHNTAGDQEHP